MSNNTNHQNQEYNLFVGGLHQETNESTIKEYFSKFGDIVTVNLIIDWVTNQSKRCAIIVCKTKKTMRKILNKKKHRIDNKPVRVNRADRKKKGTKIIKTKKIFVGNLKDEILKSELKIHFKKYGEIKNLTLVKNSLEKIRMVGTHAIIEYSNEKQAKYALDCRDEHTINERKLTVSPFKANKQSEMSRIYELLSDYETHVVNNCIMNYFNSSFTPQVKSFLSQPGAVELFVDFVKAVEGAKTEFSTGYGYPQQQQQQRQQQQQYWDQNQGQNCENWRGSYTPQESGNFQNYQKFENYQNYGTIQNYGQTKNYQNYGNIQTYGKDPYQNYDYFQGYNNDSRGYCGAEQDNDGLNSFTSNYQHMTRESGLFNKVWDNKDAPEFGKCKEEEYLELLPEIKQDNYGSYGDVNAQKLKSPFEREAVEKSKEEIEEENFLKEVFGKFEAECN